ncbi:MAG: hypothetical protein J3R72DRAFT_490643 [Linnemannia gamsii]|nr:MAG: hypothetical protein J3R72DRAFT_490643 [Linnemannia gamsii]
MSFVLHGPDPSVFDTSNRKPHVVIIGAGLAGLALAVLLQKAGILYNVFEKFPQTRNVGAAMFLGANLGPIFTQMRIMDEYMAKSRRCSTIRLFNERREKDFVLDFSLDRELSGYECRLIPRKVLYEIILAQVPEERLHKGKRMLWMTQGENGVHVKFSDGSEFEGDLLVGAHGAYSAVRQSLSDRLKKGRKLPASDSKELPFSCVSVAGYTRPLDPEKFPFLKEEESSAINNRSDEKPYSESSKLHTSFRTTDWGEGGADSMCKDVRDFPIPGGDGTLTLGDLIDKTPKDQMAKVMLEEKVFDTWYYCRAVLLGDCTFIFSAFIDTFTLTTQVKYLEKAFKAYRNERQVAVQKAEGLSKQFCKFYGKNMPFLIWKVVTKKIVANRPQASFLPYVKDNGSAPPADLESFRETLKIIQVRAAAEAKEEGAKKADKTESNVPAGEGNNVTAV